MLTRRTPDSPAGTPEVLLQHRADWVHHGGTWSVPGGAIQRDETAWETALREVREETGLDVGAAHELARYVDDHGGWSYTTIIATLDTNTGVSATLAQIGWLDTILIGEQQDLSWRPVAAVDGLALHPGFVDSWPAVRSLVLTTPTPAPRE
jgi:8-oxo-dGTP pyrophosphatase MutT (NUDIX family)